MTMPNKKAREALDTLALGLDNAVPPTMPERPAPDPHDPAALNDVDGHSKTGQQLLASGLETQIRKAQK